MRDPGPPSAFLGLPVRHYLTYANLQRSLFVQ
jgi:hypothetical protein